MNADDIVPPYECGLDAAVDVIGGKWKVSILWALAERPRRPGELRRGVKGISEKMLIQQLRQMEGDGLVTRTAYPEIPPRVEYSLTPLGLSLNAALAPLGEWGEEHMDLIAGRRRTTAA
ncbi:helix-turn-helix transcriptional regulator [Solirubrobacter phytolaccae]|uniref:Helix-turn-helix transcriptional regulator n=1 Tax=Solirubrobacter phytolaccae TaxID=1404360 RepID=A0A9X3N3F0_9ACTN|nr:helix-turn-helix domain-containing protein [Solirubrobacter phytolaccae]MDA0178993.1 helix-turn-helix transcriptional regulator [Solirubrobacter phytolaccae]